MHGRLLADAVAGQFCQVCLPARANFNPYEPNGASLDKCNMEPKLGGKCPCFQEAERRSAIDTQDVPPQLQLWKQLRNLYQFLECPAISDWLVQVLALISRSVDAEADNWADFTWHKSADADVPSAPGGAPKRRRLDPHVRQFALQSAASGQQPTVAASLRSLQSDNVQAHKLVAGEMAAYQATLRLTWARPTTILVQTLSLPPNIQPRPPTSINSNLYLISGVIYRAI